MKINNSKTSVFLLMVLFLGGIGACVHQPDEVGVPGGGNGGNNPPAGNNCNPDSVYFEKDILPLLRSNCAMAGCHDGATAMDGVRLDSYQAMMNSDVVKPRNPGDSDLWEAINENDPDDRMPYQLPPLNAQQKALIRKWIEQGALNNRCDNECDTTLFTFSAAVKPILDKNCVGCHNITTTSGGVRLHDYAAVFSQTSNGKLSGVIHHRAGFKPMPYGGGKLRNCEITIIDKWISSGAPNN